MQKSKKIGKCSKKKVNRFNKEAVYGNVKRFHKLYISCKDDTKFSVELISIISNKSKKVVTKYLNEFKRKRYVNVLKKNSKDGFYYEYFIYESKTINLNFYNENPDTKNPSWESLPMDTVPTNTYYNK